MRGWDGFKVQREARRWHRNSRDSALDLCLPASSSLPVPRCVVMSVRTRICFLLLAFVDQGVILARQSVVVKALILF